MYDFSKTSAPTLALLVKRIMLTASLPIFAIFLLSALPSREIMPAVKPEKATHQITLLFAGDVMQHMPQVDAAWNPETGRYEYDSCFMYIRPYLESADLTIANLETTLAGKPYSGYPAFSSPDDLVRGLLNAGVDIVGTANNHCCDRGSDGIARTVSVLDSIGMIHMGTYASEQAYKKNNPLIINTRGFRLAFLNYTYGTNGIPTPAGRVVSLMENDRMVRDMKAARDSAVDAVIVFIHWGIEYQREPNEQQKATAELLFSNGADLIIGSHPHVIQPMEWTKSDPPAKDKLVVWSLGNFVSNQRKQYTDGGTMASVTLKKQDGKVQISEAGYRLTWVYNPLSGGRRQYFILPAAGYENDTLFADSATRASLKQFLTDSHELLRSGSLNFPELGIK
jgi:poly-gamma-glutamate capsule biosynthesis protein CapA/YwtB (metallophosphatase superfamily)